MKKVYNILLQNIELIGDVENKIELVENEIKRINNMVLDLIKPTYKNILMGKEVMDDLVCFNSCLQDLLLFYKNLKINDMNDGICNLDINDNS